MDWFKKWPQWVCLGMHNPLWWGQGLVPGPADDIYSDHTEAFGLLPALFFLQYYITCYKCPTPACLCDNLGAITNVLTIQAEDIPCPNDTTNDDHNLYLAIKHGMSCSHLKFQFLHVKGHQDTNQTQPLTQAETYNMECNCHAEQFVK